jgi:putative FmdB family regulatory protein
MPLFDIECQKCQKIFEFLFIKTDDVAKCPFCGSDNVKRLIGLPHIRMNPDGILTSVPDPSPPLEELRGKTRQGCEGGYADKPETETQLKNYKRKKDKYGNTLWEEKRKQYIDLGENK